VIELPAAIPSVVWGFIGYAMLSPLIMSATDAAIGINLLNGAIILALMSVPIVVSIGEDALRAVPDSYREAALAHGASRLQVALRVLLPGARHGLLAAALLGVGRAIGETMAVLMATGHAVQIPHSVLDPVRTLTATIAAELGETVAGGVHYRALFVLGSVLMLISLITVYAAVARDLRCLLMIARINSEIERIGDEAMDNCRWLETLHPRALIGTVHGLSELSSMTLQMLHGALEALENEDVDQAQAVIAMDDRIDAMEARVLHDLAQRSAQPPDVAPSVGLVLVGRSLERTADHATNICEEIYYWLQGEDIRHRD
jgi:ABC-type molybdate transport system permease subunit